MEPSILKSFADNPALFKAVKELVRGKFYEDGVFTGMTNEELGQIVRARIDGLKKVDEAFAEIESHKTLKEQDESFMPGR